MDKFVNSARCAIESKNWFAALFLSLTLPDICGKLQNPNEKNNGKRYRSWCEKYLNESYRNCFSAKDCWKLRNACLHQGSDSDVEMTFKRIHFNEPNSNNTWEIHCNIINNVLQFQIDTFCKDLCNSVEKWLDDVESDNLVRKRMNALMKVHPISSLGIIKTPG